MSAETQSVENMSRDDLESEVEDLRERVAELENVVESMQKQLGPAVAKFLNEVGDVDHEERANWNDVEIIPVAGQASEAVTDQQRRLDSAEDMIRRHESQIQNGKAVSDSSGDHWQNVVEQAHNMKTMNDHRCPDGRVKLYKDDIAKAIKPGEKRASQLMEEWTNTDSSRFKQGVELQPYKPPAASRNGQPQRKAIKIDVEVWSEDYV